jgi:predicted nucleic acid-binding protein
VVLVDSSVWVDYFNGAVNLQTQFLDSSLQKEEVVLGDLVLLEVLQGFHSDRDYATARNALLNLPILPLGGTATALQAADNYRRLRRRGVTVRKTVDCLIATFAIEHGLTLLYRDRDFDPFVQFLGLLAAV